MQGQDETRLWKSLDIAILIFGVAMVIYHVISAFYFFVGPNQHLNIHLGFSLLLVLLSLIKKSKKPWLLSLLILSSLLIVGFVAIHIEELERQVGTIVNPSIGILIISILLIITVLETTRRLFGWVLLAVIVMFFLYPFFGHYIPGYFHFFSIDPLQVLSRIGIGSMGISGIYGTFLNISANQIFLFMVFGVLLQASGATRFFTEVGRFIGAKFVGGPALSSIVTSSLVGMVSGNVTANIVITGSFTIPLMKSVGYKPHQAAAIEAVSSTGGPITPPVMGAVAFLMASFTGISYLDVMVLAVIPAVLYYLSAALYVRFHALKQNIACMEHQPDFGEMLRTAPLFLIPLAIIMYLLVTGHSLPYTMSITISVLVFLSLIRKESRLSLKKWIEGLTEGAILGAEIAVISSGIAILMTCISLTGLGLKLPVFVRILCGGNVLLALVLTMFTSLILGMGMSSIGAYVLVVIVTGPILVKMGIPIVVAHLFAFYYSLLSFITPPVAIGCVVASKLGDTSFGKTSLEAMKVSIGGLAVPFLFVFMPSLLLQIDNPFWAIAEIAISVIIIVALQITASNYYLTSISYFERALFALIALASFFFIYMNNRIALVLPLCFFVAATTWQWWKRKSQLDQENLSVRPSQIRA